jgi:hypothetical protein
MESHLHSRLCLYTAIISSCICSLPILACASARQCDPSVPNSCRRACCERIPPPTCAPLPATPAASGCSSARLGARCTSRCASGYYGNQTDYICSEVRKVCRTTPQLLARGLATSFLLRTTARTLRLCHDNGVALQAHRFQTSNFTSF